MRPGGVSHALNPDTASARCILYIEDDLVLLNAYRRRLEQAGFDVESSVDGLEAMRILAARTFDLIILDLMVPRFSGADILKAIRDNPRLKSIPVIIFSANLESVEESVLGLAQKSLLKGQCTFQNLLQTINELLAKQTGGAGE
jgi:DNA-binding response OmpR family regulator